MASKLSKKHLFALSGTAAAVMLLAGCGASESSDDNVAAYETNDFGIESERPGNQVADIGADTNGAIYLAGSDLTTGKYLQDFSFVNTGNGSYVLRTEIAGVGETAFKLYGDGFVCGYNQPDASSRPNGELAKISLDSVVSLACAETAEDAGSDILLDFSSSANYTFLLSYTVADDVIDYSSFTFTATDKTSVDVPPLSLPVYIRGGLNGANDDWSAREENLLSYQGNNVYALEKEFPAGMAILYKAGGPDWEADGSVYNCGGAGSVAVDSTSAGECGATSDNVSVVTSDSGLYKFTVDYTTQANPVFGFDLVEAVELHPFGSTVGTGISNKLYFVSPELTSGVARVKGELAAGSSANTYVSTVVRLEKGSYTFFVQDPSGTVIRFGGNNTTVVANRNNPDLPDTGSVDVIANSNEMIKLDVEQAGDYVIGLDMRSATARIGVFANTPVYCKGTCVPEDFGDVVTISETPTAEEVAAYQGKLFLLGTLTGWDARENAMFTEGDSGIFSLIVSDLRAATYNVKFADATWGGWGNDGPAYNCGALVAGDVLSVGSPLTGVCSEAQDIELTISEQDDYIFTVDMTNSAAPIFTVDKYVPSGCDAGVGLYVRGSVIDAGWTAVEDYKFCNFGGLYSLTTDSLIVGVNNAFKIADATWGKGVDDTPETDDDTYIDYGLPSGGELVLGEEVLFQVAGNDMNTEQFVSGTSYTFSVDMTGYDVTLGAAFTPTVFITETVADAGLCLKGTVNGWDCTEDYMFKSLGDGRYYLKASIPEGNAQFKFADATWGNGVDGTSDTDDDTFVDFGLAEDVSFAGDNGSYALAKSGADITFTSQGGTYEILVDLRGFVVSDVNTTTGDFSFSFNKVAE